VVKTHTSDRACKQHTKCSATQHQTRDGSALLDRTCQDNVSCTELEYQTKDAGTHHNRECDALSTCAAGMYEHISSSATTDRTCHACPVGQFKSSSGNDTTCTRCAKGHFQGKTGQLSCKTCAAGSKQPELESTTCVVCSAGQFQSAVGQASCAPCAMDHFQDKKGAVQCDACTVIDTLRKYTTRSKEGQTQCHPAALDCKPSAWGSWGSCTHSCSGGQQNRVRMPDRQEPCSLAASLGGGDQCAAQWGGGKACAAFSWSEDQTCNTHPCPVDCVVSAWAAWGECSTTCGTGTAVRTRAVSVPVQFGGKQCAALTSTHSCNPHKCEWKPKCHHKHVHCKVKTLALGDAATARVSTVIQVTHDKGFAHVDAAYHCKIDSSDSASCGCFCDKHPPCCTKPGMLLSNEALLGNKFSNVDSEQTCCNMCTNHPSCTGWEFGKSTCVLKGGPPQFTTNPREWEIHTVAGLPSGQTCDSTSIAAP